MSIISSSCSDSPLPEISNSLRFNGTSNYLSKTPSVAGNRRKWTWSGWVKRSGISTARLGLFAGGTTATDTGAMVLEFYNDYTLRFSTGATQMFRSQSLYRDPSSHLHVVLVFDCSNVTTGDRVILYVNGSRVTSSAYSAPSDADHFINSTGVHYLGCYGVTTPNLFFDGYLSNVCFIDGSALTPTSFAYTDPNGQCRSLSGGQLKALASAGGTNSFFLDFSNGASTTTLGYDSSSKGNNFTLTSMVRDGSVDDCWSYDTPTNNFATLNPVNIALTTVSNGALNSTSTSVGYTPGNLPLTSGLWYWECMYPTQVVSGSNKYPHIGIQKAIVFPTSNLIGQDANGVSVCGVGNKYYNGSNVTNYGAIATTSVAMFALDATTGKFWVGKDETWFASGNPLNGTNPIHTLLFSEGVYPSCTTYSNSVATFNFGQRPVTGGAFDAASGGYFRYTPPAGFKALCTKNLGTPSIVDPSKHLQVKLNTGANIKSTCEAVFPSAYLEFIKDRVNANNWQWIDNVRGSTAVLQSNTTAAETTYTAPTGNSVGYVLKSGGSAVTNTSGSITSQVSANTTSGFSIVTYTGTGANATVGHGLGIAPKMVIVKVRSVGGTYGAVVWHSSFITASNSDYLTLNSTAAKGAVAANYWNSTTPTSSVFSIGTAGNTNAAQTYVAYCFAEVPGYSKVGSYTGNGVVDGPFIWCGFRPKFLMVKASVGTSAASVHWIVVDAARDPENIVDMKLAFNGNAIENDGTAYGAAGTNMFDFLSNGFKVRHTAINTNESATTYIFLAFAEAPFQYANAR